MNEVYLIPIAVFHGLISQPQSTGLTMSENSGSSSRPMTSPTDSLLPLRQSEAELPAMFYERQAPTPRLSLRQAKDTKEGEDLAIPAKRTRMEVLDSSRVQAVEADEIMAPREEEQDLEESITWEKMEMVGPRGEEEKVMEKLRRKEDQVERLESEIGKMRGFYEDVQRRAQHIRTEEERLKRAEKLLATRSAELSGAHAFLSATDRLSDVEVLGIVRDLNENIYQVAVNLTDEWEKLGSSQTTGRMDIDTPSRPRSPTLVQRVLSRNPAGLTFLLQSSLCSQVVKMTSSWGHHQELAILKSVYKRLSASGEYHIVGPRQYVTYVP